MYICKMFYRDRDSVAGISGFSMCQVVTESIGGKIHFVETDPVYAFDSPKVKPIVRYHLYSYYLVDI